jgi:malonate transporter and related proteins
MLSFPDPGKLAEGWFMIAIIGLVLPLFGLTFLGFIAGRIAKISFEGLAWLNFFVLYLALPALIFQLLSQTPVSEFTNISFIAITTTATLLVFCLTFFIAGIRNGGNVGEATIQGFAGAYGNIGYMGPPLALAAFGPEAAVPVALIFCFDNSLHFTLGPLLMAFHTQSGNSPINLLKKIITRIFSHPFILATLVAIFFATLQIQPPNSVNRLLEMLAGAAAPCALFAMGVTAAVRPLKRVPPELGYILPIKLLVHPVLVFVLLAYAAPDTEPVWVQVAVLMAALPVAANVFVIAQQYGIWQERASSAVVIGTFASIFTVTILLYFIAGDAL